MSLDSWNRGLDDAACGSGPSAKYADDPDYQEGYNYGTPDPRQFEPPPTPSEEELCAEYGHQYQGDDDDGPRCHCGLRRDFGCITVVPMTERPEP